MATYSTDLTTATTAESGTWTEFDDANSGGTPAADGENFIQGTDCYSQTTGTKSGTANPKSVVYNHGSDLSSGWATGDAFFLWQFYSVGPNLYDYDQTTYSGLEVGIGADTTNVDRFFTGGADVRRNPYGGWDNVAVDPEQTADETYGTGGAGYQYIGSIAYTINAISKGTPHAVDAIRYGRGEISIIGSGGTFAELASYNDYNAGGTPPGTSSTSVDSGYHRLGLFSAQGGTFLWKGLLSFGTTGSPGAVTFSDSNETIIIDDCPHTYADFNKVEVNNADSSVTLTNITFIATGIVAPGAFEMVANATVAKSGCSFNGMGTFVYDTNATITNCNYNSCGLVTIGGATFSGCKFNSSTATSAVTTTSLEDLTDCTFTSGGTGHAVTLTSLGDGTMDWNNYASGYSDGSPETDATIYVNVASGSLTINVGSGYTTPSIRTAGAEVTVSSGAVTVQVTAQTAGGTKISGARVLLKAASGSPEGALPVEESVTIARTGSPETLAIVSHTGHGMITNDYVAIDGADQPEYNGVKQITKIDDNSYSFVCDSSPLPTTPATGTITATFVALYGLTNASGVVSTSRSYAVNQPVSGWARKSTSTPFYKEGPLNGIVDTGTGFNQSAVMVLDE